MAGWGYIDTSTLSDELLDAFTRCGAALFHGGLNNSHSGNLSVRAAAGYWVTRTRSMCHEIRKGDVIWAGEDGSGDREKLSREFMVHAAIYAATDHRAVVHCHPQAAISLGFIEDEFRPIQIEGHGALPGVVPVLEVDNASASRELCDRLAPMLAQYPAVLVRGHGLFVGADSLDQATHRAFVVNESAHFIMDMKHLGANLNMLRAKPYLAAGYKSAPTAK